MNTDKMNIAIAAINNRLAEIEAQKPTDELLKEFGVLIAAKMHYEFKDDLKDFIGLGVNPNTQQRQQLMTVTSNLVKSHHNLNSKISGQRDLLIEARRIIKAYAKACPNLIQMKDRANKFIANLKR